MNRIFYVLIALFVTAPLLLFPAQASEENADKTLQLSDVTDYMEKVCARLEDKESAARMSAREQLRVIRKTMKDNHIAKLKNLSQKPDNSYGSPLHLTIQSIGEWRIKSGVVSSLVDMIDYELDKSTLPKGKKYTVAVLFPGAFALSKIADKYVGRTIIARLQTELNKRTIRICVWTLFETYGEDVAAFMLEKEESNERNNDAVKQRMKTAKELVANGGRLIVFDEETNP